MQKVAILIDGGFFLKALKAIFKNKIALDQFDITSAPDVVKLILGQVNWHLNYANTISLLEHVDIITSSFSADSVNSILNKNEWVK